MTDPAQRAAQLVVKFLDDHCFQLTSSPPAQHPLDAQRELTVIVATALRTIEAETWEAAYREAKRHLLTCQCSNPESCIDVMEHEFRRRSRATGEGEG